MVDQTLINSIPLTLQCQTGSQTSLEDHSSKLKETCSELESLFVFYLMKEMRASVQKSDLFGNRNTEEKYTSMMDMQIAKDLTAKRGIGISSVLFEKLSKCSEQNMSGNKKNIKS